MSLRIATAVFSLFLLSGAGVSAGPKNSNFGERLPGSNDQITLWWCSSGWKVGQTHRAPTTEGRTVSIRTAKNETEAAQLVLRPGKRIKALSVHTTDLQGPGSAVLPAGQIDVLKVGYVNVTKPTDKTAAPGLWPDPLPALKSPLDLQPDKNQALWIRVKAPKNQPAGIYKGRIHLKADSLAIEVPLEVEVYDFTLPDRMQCTTAFGFSPQSVFRYHGLKQEKDKRAVLEKYWDNFADHHVSPYDPTPMDPIKVTWPDVTPPPKPWADWKGIRIVTNEKHQGEGSLLLHDDQVKKNITASYIPLIPIPQKGIRLNFHYRVAVPDHTFVLTLNHFDEAGNWLSGRNNDIPIKGNGTWQEFNQVIPHFPEGAKSIQLHIRPVRWTEDGKGLGLVWIDSLSIQNLDTNAPCLTGGNFDPVPPRTKPVVPAEQLQVTLDFTSWDAAMKRAMNERNFNSFNLTLPGLGGGTYHAINRPSLRGFTEEDPEYEILLESYLSQIEKHLKEQGWIDQAYVYWFDEPSADQYTFVKNGFSKLKRHAPDIRRMITEQVEDGLIGGPNIWCPAIHLYDESRTADRRKHGEEFWWYVCTEPKAPYTGLFIDHPGTEMRVWLWQSWKHGIDGILVWQSNYWTSAAAYPDHPQNPYEDPMAWTTGYSTPAGVRKPWGNGDGRFIYPPESAANADSNSPVLEGPVDSIRWELLRDGIEDYEYFAILQRLLTEQGDNLSKQQRDSFTALLKVPENVSKSMTSFTTDPAPMEKHRDELARAISNIKQNTDR